jgi:hypothetical protein
MAGEEEYPVNCAIGPKEEIAFRTYDHLPFQTRSNPVILFLSFRVDCIDDQAYTMTFPSKDGSNYHDSIAALVLLPLILIVISIRIYLRGFVTKRLGWDDITAVIAVVRSCSKSSSKM